MKIRRANIAETNELLQLTSYVMGESSMGYVPSDINIGYNVFSPLLNNGAYYLIAVKDHWIIGWVLIGPDFNPIHTEKTGSILSIYVFPDYRNEGVGKQLMMRALKELQQHNYRKVHLNVYTGNPAKILYEKLGFHDVSTVMEMNLN